MIETEYAADWRSLGACLTADPDLFFPISSSGPALREIERAKSVCATCQVKQECLEFALTTHQVHGVWGGTSAEERQALTRRRARRQASFNQPARPAASRPLTTVPPARPGPR